MKFKRYAVTVMDNWTPMREFWTRQGALMFYCENAAAAHIFKWIDGRWQEIGLWLRQPQS